MNPKKKIFLIAGARPNFMKVAPLYRKLMENSGSYEAVFVHTGQHYDDNMSNAFLRDLELPTPHIALNVGSASHAVQTARIMMAFEKAVEEHQPDLVVVVGDVNSTIACALVASKLGISVAHIEAGLRSFDREMPEEINRVLTDQLSDLLFTTCADGNQNLMREGIPADRIHFIGNLMIESLIHFLPRIDASTILEELNLEPKSYALMTLHRPSNVDNPESLQNLISSVTRSLNGYGALFPVHPRTRQMIEKHGIQVPKQIRLTDPIPYYGFLNLQKHAKCVITDSGGIQEETTYFQTPCLTLRENTERPITITEGTNQLVGVQIEKVESSIAEVMQNEAKSKVKISRYWDDQVSERFMQVVNHYFSNG